LRPRTKPLPTGWASARCRFKPTTLRTNRLAQAGDVEITLENDDRVCTVYEMKQKVVTLDDLDRAIQKVAGRPQRVDNYVVITTDRIDPTVAEYAATLYESTGGTEYVVLDCLGFVRHYLHLFHRRRAAFWMRTSHWCWTNRSTRGGAAIEGGLSGPAPSRD
jgi:hypothetical protein